MQRYLKAIMSLESILKPTNGVAATAGAFLAPLMGGKLWVYMLFLAVIGADWISGMAAAKKHGVYKTEYGLSGVLRTVLLLWIPFIGLLLDKVSTEVFGINQPGVAFYAITFMLSYHSWESMTANTYRAGWGKWIPKIVLDFVAQEIKAKGDRAQGIKKAQAKGGAANGGRS